MWFDASGIDPASAQSQFPVGRHPVIIRSSSSMAVKDKPNEGMLVLQLEIIEGQNKGVTGPYRLNLWNASEQAKEIASKQLSAICHVTGKHQLVDKVNMCSEMFNIPFVIVVSQQTQNPQYTQIDGVLDMGGNVAKRGQVPTQPHQTQQQPVQQPTAGPSWQSPQQTAPQPQQTAPSWQPPGQPQQQPQQQTQQQPAGQPSWSAPTPQQQPAQPQQPSWSNPPAGAAAGAAPGQPSWVR